MFSHWQLCPNYSSTGFSVSRELSPCTDLVLYLGSGDKGEHLDFAQ